MAKSDWSNGSWLWPSFMDTFFGTNASTGHVHSGLDADGSAPKIDGTHIDYHGGTVDVTSNDVNGGFSSTWNYEVHGKIVNLYVSEDLGPKTIKDPTYLRIYPKTTWPAVIISSGFPVAALHGVWYGSYRAMGFVLTPDSADAAMTCAYLHDGTFNYSIWSGGCGITQGLITYYKE